MYSLLGTSRQLNVAPEAALSLLVGQAVSDFRREGRHYSPEDAETVGIAVSTAITFQVVAFSIMGHKTDRLTNFDFFRWGCLRRCLDSFG
jgi:MFS superfamily sulfate permease-like transporter